MRALILRTSGASVSVERQIVGEIEEGLVVFVCAMRGDSDADSEWLARKTVNLRIFSDAEGRMNRPVVDAGGSALVVSQFTLAAETKGNRPGFSAAHNRKKGVDSTSTLRRRSAAMASAPPPAASAPR